MLWDLEPYRGEVPERILRGLEEGEREGRNRAMEYLERLRKEAAERREREARIKGEWLERSYNDLIQEANAKLFEYHRRAEKGEDMRIAIQQEEENLKRLIHEKQERLGALERERILTLLEPQPEAVFVVCGGPSPEAGKEGDEEARRRVEKVGMEVAMRYEREQGRNPVDISTEYLGYDIRSEGGGEVRYIEVKAFATTGEVHFTPHEWQISQRLGQEYWLYVVENAATNPTLHTIQNPARLRAEPIAGVVAVVVQDWKKG
jgi:hypothetical protein